MEKEAGWNWEVDGKTLAVALKVSEVAGKFFQGVAGVLQQVALPWEHRRVPRRSSGLLEELCVPLKEVPTIF